MPDPLIPAELIVPYTEGMDYGVGIDTPSGGKRNVAVEGQASEIQNAPGSILQYGMHLVTSEEDLQKELGISASASGGVGLFSASARLDFSEKCSFHVSSVLFLVQATIRTAFSSIRAPEPSGVATRILESGDFGRFQRQFGDMFVRGLRRGGVFVGAVKVLTRSESEQRDLGIAVAGSSPVFKADGKFSSKFVSTMTGREISIKLYQEGGDVEERSPDTLEDLQELASKWAASAERRPVAYAALLASYAILDLPKPPTFFELEEQKRVLAELSVLRNQNWQLLRELNYILVHPDEFEECDATALTAYRDSLSADLATITEAASNALERPKDAEMPKLKTGVVKLPRRMLTAPTAMVPDLSPHTSRASCIELLEWLGLKAQIASNDPYASPWSAKAPPLGDPRELVVVGQDPPPGTSLARGSTVRVDVVGRQDIDYGEPMLGA